MKVPPLATQILFVQQRQQVIESKALIAVTATSLAVIVKLSFKPFMAAVIERMVIIIAVVNGIITS